VVAIVVLAVAVIGLYFRALPLPVTEESGKPLAGETDLDTNCLGESDRVIRSESGTSASSTRMCESKFSLYLSKTAATSSAAWQNTTGRDIYFTDSFAAYLGKASTSEALKVGTSTDSGLGETVYDVVDATIMNENVATGTQPFLSGISNDERADNVDFAVVHPNEWVVARRSAGTTLLDYCDGDTKDTILACEFATSTQKGGDVLLWFEYQYRDTN